MVLSSCHRLSGIFLSCGIPLIIYWLYALASGPEMYATAMSFFSHWFIKLILFIWTAAFYYHLCNGIRHLFWDMGKGFEMDVLRKSGIAVVIATGFLTIATWLIA